MEQTGHHGPKYSFRSMGEGILMKVQSFKKFPFIPPLLQSSQMGRSFNQATNVVKLKVDVPKSNIAIIWTPIFEWFMWLGADLTTDTRKTCETYGGNTGYHHNLGVRGLP
jgi:hypothetical protein